MIWKDESLTELCTFEHLESVYGVVHPNIESKYNTGDRNTPRIEKI